MTMKKYFLLALLFIGFNSMAQTWSGEVAQIFYNKCTQCHHTGGGAPFSLMTYQEASPMAAVIAQVVNDNCMPPWPPDNNYQQYQHTRSLSSLDKATLINWIAINVPEGNAASTPPPPIYNNNNILGNGDLTIQMPTYMSKATAMADDYVCFAIPTNLTQNRIIKAVEVIPGNPDIVHHALVYYDPTSAEVTDTVGGNCASPSNANTKLITGFTPGATPMILPSVNPLKMGITIGAGSQIYLNMHYPDGSYGLFDSTKVIFHFYPIGTTGVRQISASPVIGDYMFALPPNQLTTLAEQYPAGAAGVPVDLSVISVFPHMHLLGESIKSYATGPANDTIKFINIPHWDFHWQDFYYFTQLKHLPAGYTIKGEAVYDNTAQNPHNPNSPPQTVTIGYNTTDEMFIIYFHYMLYQAGDENYDLEALTSSSLAEYPIGNIGSVVCYPNPMSSNGTIISLEETIDAKSMIYIYDGKGNLIRKLNFSNLHDATSVFWDGANENNAQVSPGIYYVSAKANDKMMAGKLIKH